MGDGRVWNLELNTVVSSVCNFTSEGSQDNIFSLGFYSIQGHLFYIDLWTRVEGNALKLWSIDLNVADEWRNSFAIILHRHNSNLFQQQRHIHEELLSHLQQEQLQQDAEATDIIVAPPTTAITIWNY